MTVSKSSLSRSNSFFSFCKTEGKLLFSLKRERQTCSLWAESGLCRTSIEPASDCVSLLLLSLGLLSPSHSFCLAPSPVSKAQSPFPPLAREGGREERKKEGGEGRRDGWKRRKERREEEKGGRTGVCVHPTALLCTCCLSWPSAVGIRAAVGCADGFGR